MTEPEADLPAFWKQGVALFNAGRFWEAHEALETVWRRAPAAQRDHWQGLIQAAAALLHQSRGNTHGTEAVGGAAVRKLREPAPAGFPIETHDFVEALARRLAGAGPLPVMKEQGEE